MSSTLAQYFGLIAALGIPIYGMQEIAKVRDDKNAYQKYLPSCLAFIALAAFWWQRCIGWQFIISLILKKVIPCFIMRASL